MKTIYYVIGPPGVGKTRLLYKLGSNSYKYPVEQLKSLAYGEDRLGWEDYKFNRKMIAEAKKRGYRVLKVKMLL